MVAAEVADCGEGTEELVVQVVAVGDDDYGGIFHRRVADDFAGVEHHGEALARALGMPDDAGAAIAEASCVLGGRLFDGKGVSRLGLDESGIKRIRVALDATGNQCGGQRLVDGVILMIARGLLGDAGLATAVILKRNEIQDIIQKSARSSMPRSNVVIPAWRTPSLCFSLPGSR